MTQNNDPTNPFARIEALEQKLAGVEELARRLGEMQQQVIDLQHNVRDGEGTLTADESSALAEIRAFLAPWGLVVNKPTPPAETA